MADQSETADDTVRCGDCGKLWHGSDTECQTETAPSALAIIQRQFNWIIAKHEAARRMGLRDAERRYWQRAIALDDAMIAIAEAGITR
jgi:hypothetical protein